MPLPRICKPCSFHACDHREATPPLWLVLLQPVLVVRCHLPRDLFDWRHRNAPGRYCSTTVLSCTSYAHCSMVVYMLLINLQRDPHTCPTSSCSRLDRSPPASTCLLRLSQSDSRSVSCLSREPTVKDSPSSSEVSSRVLHKHFATQFVFR